MGAIYFKYNMFTLVSKGPIDADHSVVSDTVRVYSVLGCRPCVNAIYIQSRLQIRLTSVY